MNQSEAGDVDLFVDAPPLPGSQQTGTETAGETATAPSPNRSSDLRFGRIDDLRQDSLLKSDSLDASIGLVNCDLLLLASMLGPEVIKAISSQPDRNELGESVPTGLNDYLRLVKQVERFSEFQARRDREARRAAAKEFGPAFPR